MNIDRLARWYRPIEYAAFGKALDRRRFAFLTCLAGARRVLILGEGDGRTLARLLALAPMARFDVVEKSAKMIALARRRTGDSERVRFLCRDAIDTEWPIAHYDALLTLFFPDRFAEEDAGPLIRRLERTLTPGAAWLVSDFAIPERGWRRWHAQLWVKTMYRFFYLTTGLRTRALPPIERLLNDVGMQRIRQERERGGMMVSEVWIRRESGSQRLLTKEFSATSDS